MVQRSRDEWQTMFKAGTLAGLGAGLILAMYMLVRSTVAGQDVWPVLKAAGAPFIGERALAPGFDGYAVGIGVASHLGVSLFWGLLFSILFYGWTKASTVPLGLLYGILVWVGMYLVALPLLGLHRLIANVPVPMAILDHMIFGLSVALIMLPFQRPRTLVLAA